MAVQALCVLPVGGHDYSFWLTAVVGKVKETVPWPFPIDISAVVVLATKHQRAATSAHDIPGEEKSCQLPVFMFCASVGEVLGRKPAAVSLADDTFTGRTLQG